MPRHRELPQEFAESRIYWFAVLEKAVERGDHEKAGNAASHLRRLGVTVSILPTRCSIPIKGKAVSA